MTEPYKSALVKAKDAQPRPVTYVALQGFIGLGDAPILMVGVRTNVIRQQDVGLRAAHKYVKELAGDIDAVKSDEDVLANSKTIEALYQAFCEARTVDGKNELVFAIDGTPYPAFASPDWMRAKLTADQLATLLNIYNAVKAKESNAAKADTDDSTEEALMQIADAAGTPFPEAALAATPREVLVKLVMVAAIKLKRVRTELLTMQVEAETKAAEQ